MGHPDFRVCGRIFATLSPPDKGLGMVKLTPEQQEEVVRDEPEVFQPCKGAWGRQGCTHVRLVAATADLVRPALVAAWRNRAPERLVGSPSTIDSAPPATARRRRQSGKRDGATLETVRKANNIADAH